MKSTYVVCMNDFPSAALPAEDEDEAKAMMESYLEDFRQTNQKTYRFTGRQGNALIPESGHWLYFHLQHVPVWGKNEHQASIGTGKSI